MKNPVPALNRLFDSVKANRAVALMLPSWAEGQPIYPQANFENAVREGFRKNELIYACLQTKAQTSASVALRIYDRATHTELLDHPLRRLIERPNPQFGEFDLWSFSIVNRELAGVAYWQKLRSPAGNVVQLWPMRPDYVRPMPSASSPTGIAAYQYGAPGSDPVLLDAQDVIAFKLLDPLNLYGSLAPVQVAARVADVDNAATDYLKLFFEKGATPVGIFSSKLKLTDQAISDIQRRWAQRYGGFTRWTTPAVLDSDASYQKIGLNFQEMGFEALDGRSEARICMILQVPPVLIQSTIGLSHSTYSNFDTARKVWWTDHIIPNLKHLADTVNNQLVPEFGEDVIAEWDLSKVAALQEESNDRWSRVTAAYSAGILTLNDARREMGLSDVGPSGDTFAQSSPQMPDAKASG